MNRTIWLDTAEPKCIASACRNPKPCARRDVAMVKGRPLTDFSQPFTYMAPCSSSNGWSKFIAHDKAVPPTVKPAVRDWIGQ